jgi:uncharacterized protein YbaR (Trm112 family)
MVEIIRIMRCKKCKGSSFKFRWKYDKKDEMALLLCHDGYGFEMEDSELYCTKCKKWVDWNEDDTTEVVIEKTSSGEKEA